MASMGKMTVLVWGHSFVVSFNDSLLYKYGKSGITIPFPKYVAQFLKVDHLVAGVHLVGKSGGKITSNLHLPVDKLTELQPDMVIIEAGANDAAKNNIKIHDISTQLIDHARALRDLYQVNLTVVCSLIKRDIGMDMTAERYFDKIFYINHELKEALRVEPGIKYHVHPGFWRDGNGAITDTSHFSFDGLHPNSPDGRHKYARSIREIIHHGVRDIKRSREKRTYPGF